MQFTQFQHLQVITEDRVIKNLSITKDRNLTQEKVLHILADVTEQSTQRPKRKQKKSYSCKKEAHTSAPEVYNPDGLTLMIDDFCVKSENLWQSVGAGLIKAMQAPAKAKGASQILVVCGAHDYPKRKLLMNQNLSIASEWFVGGII